MTLSRRGSCGREGIEGLRLQLQWTLAQRLDDSAVRTYSQWRSQGGTKGAIAPPFFQGERVGGRAICHVMTLGDEQTRHVLATATKEHRAAERSNAENA